MSKLGRYQLSEVSFNRLLSAWKSRMAGIPHTFAWKFDPVGRKNKEYIREFNGIHKGDRCFIVANGPSLLKTNLDLLENELTFWFEQNISEF